MSLRILLLFIALSSQAVTAQVGKMDIHTHDIVITKLENVVKNLDKKISQKAPIILRLADLYSDRARLKFMQEMEKSCDACLGSKDDRKAAIDHYLSIIPYLDGDTQAQSLIQAAHLYKLIGNVNEAIKLYKSVAESRKNYAAVMKGSAYGGLGETYFQKGEFKQAKKYLQKALNIPETPQPGYLQYRLAWCYLNEGKTRTAIRTMKDLLSQPELLKLQAVGPDADRNSFHEDVSRDFATFLAKTEVGQKEIDDLMRLSPDAVKRSNLFFLGEETDRLGQKRGSLLVWKNYVSQNQLTDQEQLEIQIRVAQLRYDLGHLRTASKEYDKAISTWKTKGCRGSECDQLRIRLRNFVTVWNKAKKKNPDSSLLSAYQSYLSVFSDDVEMMYWAADVARHIEKHSDAMELYYRSSILAAQQLKKDENNKALRKTFEGSLLAQIEMAEATKNLDHRKRAYEHYLSLNPQGEKALEVKYQLAHLLYERGRHAEAAEAFTKVAFEKDEKQRPLRIKAADLALDSLALAKNDKAIEGLSEQFARTLPERKTEYLALQRKASLNLVAATLKDSKSSDSELKAAQNRLSAVNLKTATKEEKIAYYKNKMLLGEIHKDLNQVDSASKSLLRIKGLSDADERLALQYQLWVAEMRLEFAEAYRLSQKVDLKSLSKDQKLLKQAIFAELAGKKSDHLYRAFIKATPSRREANIIRAKLIRDNRNMWPEILKELRKLDDTPDILAALALEAYSKKNDQKSADKILKYKSIQKYPEGRALARASFLENFSEFERKIGKHRIRSRSDAQLQKTLKQRIDYLTEADSWANQAVKSTDWSLQLLTLNRVADENNRLYRDLLKLPIPRSLNRSQRAEYQKMLKAQAQPFKEKAEQVQNKIEELWSNTAAVARIENDINNSDPRLARIFEKELKRVAGAASPSRRKQLLKTLNAKNSRPSRKTILAARHKVSRDPFNRTLLEELRRLENQAGGETMVTYLDARLDSLGEKR